MHFKCRVYLSGGHNMSDNRSKNVMSQKLLVIVILPMLLLAAACTLIGYKLTLRSLETAKKEELKSTAVMAETVIDTLIPGDYRLEEDNGAYLLFKGDEDITQSYDLVDRINDMTGLEASLIYEDTRILTTVYNRNKVRYVGSGIYDKVVDHMKSTEEDSFSTTLIGTEKYYAYYHPLFNSDGTYAGAIELCSHYSSISGLAWTPIIFIAVLILVVMAVLMVLILNHNKGVETSIGKLLDFTKKASSGNDAAELDVSVLRRGDEIGGVAASVLEMHRSLRDMMDKDALTKLYNRRSANRKLDLIRSHFVNDGAPYSVAIGDIDFFKKVNDTYGHDAGDLILITVSNILQKHMKPLGFVARWGGEEFLLVFDKLGIEEAEKKLWEILEEIRATEVEYNDLTIMVTMSFGVACQPELPQDDLLKIADERLYYAKESGRNKVVSFIPNESEYKW